MADPFRAYHSTLLQKRSKDTTVMSVRGVINKQGVGAAPFGFKGADFLSDPGTDEDLTQSSETLLRASRSSLCYLQLLPAPAVPRKRSRTESFRADFG